MSLPRSLPTDRGPRQSVWRSRDFLTCWGLTALFNVAWGVVFPLRSLYFREPWIADFRTGPATHNTIDRFVGNDEPTVNTDRQP